MAVSPIQDKYEPAMQGLNFQVQAADQLLVSVQSSMRRQLLIAALCSIGEDSVTGVMTGLGDTGESVHSILVEC